MTTQFRDASGQERLLGTIYVPGATVGDVFTVQADGSLAPAPGGGSPAVTIQRGTPAEPPTTGDFAYAFGTTWDSSVCSSGHFKYVIDFGAGNETTGFINWDATVAEIITAIEALPSVGAGGVVAAPDFDLAAQPFVDPAVIEVYLVFVAPALLGATITEPTVSGDTTDGGIFVGPLAQNVSGFAISDVAAPASGDLIVATVTGDTHESAANTWQAVLLPGFPRWQLWVPVYTPSDTLQILYYVPA